MSKKAVTLLIAVVMLAMAIIIAMVFREPVTPINPVKPGHSISGSLEPSEPALSLLKKLPPPEAFVMSASDKPLPETTVDSSSENSAVPAPASVVSDAPAGSAAVTQPPAVLDSSSASVPAGESAAPETPLPPLGQAASSVSIPLPETPPPAAPHAASLPLATSPQPVEAAPKTDSVDKALASPVQSSQRNESVTVQGSQPSAPVAAAEQAEPEKQAPRVLTTSASLPAGSGKVVLSATLIMDGDVVTLRLHGNGPISAKGFLLSAPDRVVFDLPGSWKVPAPRVPSNRMIKSLRSGAQGNATRLVFDMRVKPAKAMVKQVDAKTVELSIR